MTLARLRLASAIALILSCGVRAASAQDNHYGRESYGTVATLLNGAVIGRALDMSAAFYNPAGVATIDNASFLLSSHAYASNQVTVSGTDNFTGAPLSLATSTLRPAPSFIGGTAPFKFLGRHRVGYSILTRQSTESRLFYRANLPVDGKPAQTEYLNTNTLEETWVGLTWAHPLAARAAVGATLFTAVRTQLLRRQVTGQVLYADDHVGAVSGASEFDYDSWRLVPKLGTLVDLRPLTVGATVTLPSLGLWGSGDAFYNSTAAGIDLTGDGRNDDRFASNYQVGVASHFTSGLAVGLGAALDIGPTTLFGSAEWFAARQATQVLETLPFEAQSSGEPLSHDLVLRTRAVLDAALGVRHRFSSQVAGYLSGAIDPSSIDTTSAVSVGRRPWDLLHFGGGVELTISKLQVVFGGTYTYGGQKVLLDQATLSPSLRSSLVDIQEREFRGLLGFEYKFGGGTPGKAEDGAAAP